MKAQFFTPVTEDDELCEPFQMMKAPREEL